MSEHENKFTSNENSFHPKLGFCPPPVKKLLHQCLKMWVMKFGENKNVYDVLKLPHVNTIM